MGEALGALHAGVLYEADSAVEACGSPGEVASNPSLGHRYRTYLTPSEKDDDEPLFPHIRKMARLWRELGRTRCARQRHG